MSRDVAFGEAIDRALGEAMSRDARILVFGEDVETLRRELLVRFGPRRVRNTPISESAFLGAAVGAAMAGLRPVVEIMMVDFLGVALDALLNQATKLEAFSGGKWKVPLVVRAACGGGYGDGGQHEQALWGMLATIPGLAVVVPSQPDDAAGLMLSALADPGPVVFLEHKLLSKVWLDSLGGARRSNASFDVPSAGANGPLHRTLVPVPIGKAVERRFGREITLVSVGVGVHRCLEAADVLDRDGIDAGVIDLRTVTPLDRDALVNIARETRRVLAVDEDFVHFGLAGEIAAVLAEADEGIRFARVGTEDVIPYARALEREALPNVDRIVAAARVLCAIEPSARASSPPADEPVAAKSPAAAPAVRSAHRRGARPH